MSRFTSWLQEIGLLQRYADVIAESVYMSAAFEMGVSVSPSGDYIQYGLSVSQAAVIVQLELATPLPFSP